MWIGRGTGDAAYIKPTYVNFGVWFVLVL